VADPRWKHDRISVAAHSVRELPEQQRLARQLDTLLDRVVTVVEADADDLRRLRPSEAPGPRALDLGAAQLKDRIYLVSSPLLAGQRSLGAGSEIGL
jgi:hypothetical protein